MGEQLAVHAIENGTVIDHLPANCLFKIIDILGLENDSESRMTFGTNLKSKQMGTKAIIKISSRYCAPDEMNRIAILAPQAVVNIIKDYEVVEKHHVAVPDHIEGSVKCANPMCITNNEPVKTAFNVIKDQGQVINLRCRYCEKVTTQKEIKIIK